MIIANLIYTIVDSFIDPANGVQALGLQHASAWNHGYLAAMVRESFPLVILALGIVLPIVNKFVY